MSVTASIEPLTLPTYPVGAPERNPVFFEKRVYQGSCGKVYPVPFVDRVFDTPEPVAWRSARIENEHVRLVLLPEIGGRIFLGQDKANHDYDFFYRQDVIKPALVGLAGPWISGGVEFNWPQHHRPGTFLPSDVWIETEPDGARTVWLSEHDPIERLKGMHGLRLRPGSALVELRVRLYNRTPWRQTFLWWANAAARVHDRYQSFFPPDVHYVADHAVRAQSSFPIAIGRYYGIDYGARPGANDLTWYRNIPVPTSYMVCETAFDFLGGYDHEAQGGFLHVADRHIAPGKKQWTWGNHPFGYAWDRELTDEGGPYIELMGGVYTDNQPDFSYLAPYETRVFSQFWWPYQKLGAVQTASERAALRLVVGEEGRIEVGAAVPTALAGARLILREGDRGLLDERVDLAPGAPFQREGLRMRGDRAAALELRLVDSEGREVLAYRPVEVDRARRSRPVAQEPAAAEAAASNDELLRIAEHLEQMRHPTRDPERYWAEALRRDPGDTRCHTAWGVRLLRRGLLDEAAEHLEAAIARLTGLHPNPITGEAHYHLGLVRRFQGRHEEAHALLAKAAWDNAWRAAAHYELALLESAAGRHEQALGQLEQALEVARSHNKARVLMATLLRRMGRVDEARSVLAALLAYDPLDHWGRFELALLDGGDFAQALELSRNDAQTMLDLAFDYADAGLWDEARRVLEGHHTHPVAEVAVPNPLGSSPMTRYALAWVLARGGSADEAEAALSEARRQPADHFFPSRLHEQLVLEWALERGPDPLAAFALGNLLYDRKRHEQAIAAWERSVREGAPCATVHRNLGLALWNVRRDGPGARAAYERARELDPEEGRLVYELDQLDKKLDELPERRLAFLERRREQVLARDDASVELAALLNLAYRHADALDLLLARRFHPWEGGEGAVLRQYRAARLGLGRAALDVGERQEALQHFEQALEPPPNLGEAWHPLQAKADVSYWQGRALRALGREDEARAHFEASAAERGDFSEMAVTAHGPMSWYRGLALRELGREAEARALFEELEAFGRRGLETRAEIDYFATSLPNLLVFDEDLQQRKDADHRLLIAMARHGLGDLEGARHHLEQVYAFSRSDQYAADLAREL